MGLSKLNQGVFFSNTVNVVYFACYLILHKSLSLIYRSGPLKYTKKCVTLTKIFVNRNNFLRLKQYCHDHKCCHCDW